MEERQKLRKELIATLADCGSGRESSTVKHKIDKLKVQLVNIPPVCDVELVKSKRQLYRQNKQLLEIFEIMWLLVADGVVDGCLGKRHFLKLQQIIYLALFGRASFGESWNVVVEMEWNNVLCSFGPMRREAFHDMLYEIIEMWSPLSDQSCFSAFAWGLLNIITDIHRHPLKLRPISDLKKVLLSIHVVDLTSEFLRTKKSRFLLQDTLRWVGKNISKDAGLRLKSRRNAVILDASVVDMLAIVKSSTQEFIPDESYFSENKDEEYAKTEDVQDPVKDQDERSFGPYLIPLEEEFSVSTGMEQKIEYVIRPTADLAPSQIIRQMNASVNAVAAAIEQNLSEDELSEDSSSESSSSESSEDDKPKRKKSTKQKKKEKSLKGGVTFPKEPRKFLTEKKSYEALMTDRSPSPTSSVGSFGVGSPSKPKPKQLIVKSPVARTTSETFHSPERQMHHTSTPSDRSPERMNLHFHDHNEYDKLIFAASGSGAPHANDTSEPGSKFLVISGSHLDSYIGHDHSPYDDHHVLGGSRNDGRLRGNKVIKGMRSYVSYDLDEDNDSDESGSLPSVDMLLNSRSHYSSVTHISDDISVGSEEETASQKKRRKKKYKDPTESSSLKSKDSQSLASLIQGRFSPAPKSILAVTTETDLVHKLNVPKKEPNYMRPSQGSLASSSIVSSATFGTTKDGSTTGGNSNSDDISFFEFRDPAIVPYNPSHWYPEQAIPPADEERSQTAAIINNLREEVFDIKKIGALYPDEERMLARSPPNKGNSRLNSPLAWKKDFISEMNDDCMIVKSIGSVVPLNAIKGRQTLVPNLRMMLEEIDYERDRMLSDNRPVYRFPTPNEATRTILSRERPQIGSRGGGMSARKSTSRDSGKNTNTRGTPVKSLSNSTNDLSHLQEFFAHQSVFGIEKAFPYELFHSLDNSFSPVLPTSIDVIPEEKTTTIQSVSSKFSVLSDDISKASTSPKRNDSSLSELFSPLFGNLELGISAPEALNPYEGGIITLARDNGTPTNIFQAFPNRGTDKVSIQMLHVNDPKPKSPGIVRILSGKTDAARIGSGNRISRLDSSSLSEASVGQKSFSLMSDSLSNEMNGVLNVRKPNIICSSPTNVVRTMSSLAVETHVGDGSVELSLNSDVSSFVGITDVLPSKDIQDVGSRPCTGNMTDRCPTSKQPSFDFGFARPLSRGTGNATPVQKSSTPMTDSRPVSTGLGVISDVPAGFDPMTNRIDPTDAPAKKNKNANYNGLPQFRNLLMANHRRVTGRGSILKNALAVLDPNESATTDNENGAGGDSSNIFDGLMMGSKNPYSSSECKINFIELNMVTAKNYSKKNGFNAKHLLSHPKDKKTLQPVQFNDMFQHEIDCLSPDKHHDKKQSKRNWGGQFSDGLEKHSASLEIRPKSKGRYSNLLEPIQTKSMQGSTEFASLGTNSIGIDEDFISENALSRLVSKEPSRFNISNYVDLLTNNDTTSKKKISEEIYGKQVSNALINTRNRKNVQLPISLKSQPIEDNRQFIKVSSMCRPSFVEKSKSFSDANAFNAGESVVRFENSDKPQSSLIESCVNSQMVISHADILGHSQSLLQSKSFSSFSSSAPWIPANAFTADFKGHGNHLLNLKDKVLMKKFDMWMHDRSSANGVINKKQNLIKKSLTNYLVHADS